jgi:hypothetical protein
MVVCCWFHTVMWLIVSFALLCGLLLFSYSYDVCCCFRTVIWLFVVGFILFCGWSLLVSHCYVVVCCFHTVMSFVIVFVLLYGCLLLV